MFKLAAAGALALAMIVPGVGVAEEAPPEPLADAELADNRGGFILINGQALDFSAVVDSYIGEERVLRSTVTWTTAGAVVTHVGTAADSGNADMLAALAAAGIAVTPEMLSSGSVFITEDGQTAFIHRVEGGAIANLLINVGNGREFHQETSISLGLPGFEVTQAAMREILTVRALASEIQAAVAPGF